MNQRSGACMSEITKRLTAAIAGRYRMERESGEELRERVGQ